MALTAKNLVNNELTTSYVTQYTVPGATKTRVTEIIVTNCAGAARTVSLGFVESGDTVDDGAGAGVNTLMDLMDLPQGIPMIFPMNSWLETGDLISAKASGADVFLHISGLEEA